MIENETDISNLTPQTLTGKTIQMEPLVRTHYEALREAANDSRIWVYMPNKANGEFYDSWFENCWLKQIQGTQLTYVIRCLKNNLLIGSRAYYEIDPQHKN